MAEVDWLALPGDIWRLIAMGFLTPTDRRLLLDALPPGDAAAEVEAAGPACLRLEDAAAAGARAPKLLALIEFRRPRLSWAYYWAQKADNPHAVAYLYRHNWGLLVGPNTVYIPDEIGPLVAAWLVKNIPMRLEIIVQVASMHGTLEELDAALKTQESRVNDFEVYHALIQLPLNATREAAILHSLSECLELPATTFDLFVPPVVDPLFKHTCLFEAAAKFGSFPLCSRLHQLGCPVPEEAGAAALLAGHAELAEWLFARGARRDHLAMIRCWAAAGAAEPIRARLAAVDWDVELEREAEEHVSAGIELATANGHAAALRELIERRYIDHLSYPRAKPVGLAPDVLRVIVGEWGRHGPGHQAGLRGAGLKDSEVCMLLVAFGSARQVREFLEGHAPGTRAHELVVRHAAEMGAWEAADQAFALAEGCLPCLQPDRNIAAHELFRQVLQSNDVARARMLMARGHVPPKGTGPQARDYEMLDLLKGR